MMNISKTAGYAIHAMSCIGNSRIPMPFVRDIAAKTGLQKPYLAKIINQLARDGLVVAKRGYRGGIALARPPGDIFLLEIVKAVDGEAWAVACLFGLEKCPAQGRCPAHERWNEIREEVAAILRQTTLADVMKTIPGAIKPAAGKGRSNGTGGAVLD
jgi:Rrf2 family transcriptional regulator, iron-sulfur cluster assembly transcription factor